MSNGAQAAAAGKRARAVPISASHGALTRDSATPPDGDFMGLLFDDALDVDGAPEAAQISHSQIIEGQAETIARLEASAARAKEYKTLTKVKLKEAAQRLKDYRLRVEALLGEAEAAKSELVKLEGEKKKALAQVQMMKKKLDAKVPVAPVVKKAVVKSVAVQTEAKSVRSTLVQTQETRTKPKTRAMETQTETAVEPAQPKAVAHATQLSSSEGSQTGNEVAVARKKPVQKEIRENATASQKQSPPVAQYGKPVVAAAQVTEKALLAKSDAAAVTAVSVFDAISATIDAELDFSDDDDEEEEATATSTTATTATAAIATGATATVHQSSAATTTVTRSSAAPSLVLPSLLDDAISREIDAELDFGSSSSDDSSSSSDDEDDDAKAGHHNQDDKDTVMADALMPLSGDTSVGEALPVGEVLSTVKLGHGSGVVDAITAAIDAELASGIDDEERHDATLDDILAEATDPLLPSPHQDDTARVRVGLPLDLSVATQPPTDPIMNVPASDIPRPGDVEMMMMAMPASISGAVDDISAALDAELATSSSEDENDQDEMTEPPTEQAAKTKTSKVEKPDKLSEDVEMAEPTEADVTVVKPVVANGRIPLKMSEASGNVILAEPVDKRDIDNVEQGVQAESETIETVPVEQTLEDVIREKSRALSLSSDSGSDSSDSSDSASENGDTVESNMSPAKSQLPANKRSSPTIAAQEPPFVAVESIWAASFAKKVSSPPLVGSPVRPLRVQNKREVDRSSLVEEPGAKKQKTMSVVAGEKPDAPTTGRDETPSTKPVLAPSSVNTAPSAERPAPSKRDVVPPSALPPRAWVSYNVAIAPQEAENVDVQYVTRTLGVLLKQVSSFLTRSANGSGFRKEFYSQVTKHPDVLKLCKMLADEYRHRHVTSSALVDAMTRVLRTPRTRQLVDKSLVVISVLFRNVLFRRLRLDSDQTDRNGIVSDLHTCLLHLRNQAVAGRIDKGLTLPRGVDPDSVAAVARSVATASGSSSCAKVSSMGHEIAFLAHVCAFHAAICQAIDRSDIARVLLVDVLKCHPNIKGLYCIHAMVQVDPLLLQKRWDNHGHERRSALRAVIIHVLLVIAAQSREKQETVLFKETAATLLSVVADAIDEPQLEPVGYSYGRGLGGSSNESIHEFQATLWRDYIVPCVVKASDEMELFDTASALELLGCFHGDAMMGRHFALLKFENLLTSDRTDQEDGAVNADSSEKQRRPDPVGFVKIVRLVGALCRGVLRSHSADHGSSLFVVDEVVRWMVDTFLKGEHEGRDDERELHQAVVAELTEILMGMSTQPLDHPKIAHRRDTALHKLLTWLTPSRLATLAAPSLRQLRLLVVAARPLTEMT